MQGGHEPLSGRKERTVLLVDDDIAVLQVTSRQLQRSGCRVVTASSADEAERILEAQDIPIVVCDKAMPGRDGLDLCRSLRQNPKTKGIYFIMITALGKPMEKVRALMEGVDDYIHKSFEPSELLARIQVAQRILDLQEQILQLERLNASIAMVTTLAHEINNPLTGLLGFLELAKVRITKKPLQEDDIEKIKRMLERVYEQGKRIEMVVRKLMNLKEYSTKTYLEGVEMVDIDKADVLSSAASQEKDETENQRENIARPK
ncbi:MAG: response regulator [Chloroherpetonaceae bacterium]|nr:response regulator [Chloroherpetonaceae bacterium]MCS7211904.1 response regulator [Chloroherpetonaceae bacterium]MDW8020522.1 response regulator [Chloroherpetonaceae bacterium]MDW8466207.1 response regulator [Chloroherpetonaceae bacterium]